jgi:hypothetical protein
MSDEMQLNLVQTYMWVCDMFDKNPQWNFIRMSNNNRPTGFTDQEAITIYLFAGKYIKLFDKKEIHDFAKHFLISWFPKLTSYEKFNNRLNVISPIFRDMVIYIVSNNIPQSAQLDVLLLDSMPIVTCKGRNRKAKVAREHTDKGFCATKNMYFYGLKLHILAFRNSGTLPFPTKLYFSAASENDLAFVRELNWLDDLLKVSVFADKAYCDKDYFEPRKKHIQLELFTPIKTVKGTPEHIKQHDFAYNNLFSTAVSKVRQPIESLLNWLIQKSKIQDATKVRSTNGLWCHCFGKLAIALLNFVF